MLPNNIINNQISQCVSIIDKVFRDNLVGLYLYGSILSGGIQKYSDIDLFVVINRESTAIEKKELTKELLQVSGIYIKSNKYPVEITIVVKSEINPWRYPPNFDFQYGEWLREEFERGNINPWQEKVMPDLAILITQLLLSNKTLKGVKAEQVFCKVPYNDFIHAINDELPNLTKEIDTDLRNVLLTLARIWSSIENQMIFSKASAADWAINNMPKQFALVMKRAKSIYQGEMNEFWEDINSKINPCINFLLNKINVKINKIIHSDLTNENIKLSSK